MWGFCQGEKNPPGFGCKQAPASLNIQTLWGFSITFVRWVLCFMFNRKCSPCSLCWTAGGTPGCSSSHTATTPQVSSALSEKALRLCAALSAVTSKIYPTSLLRLLQLWVWEQVHTEWTDRLQPPSSQSKAASVTYWRSLGGEEMRRLKPSSRILLPSLSPRLGKKRHHTGELSKSPRVSGSVIVCSNWQSGFK